MRAKLIVAILTLSLVGNGGPGVEAVAEHASSPTASAVFKPSLVDDPPGGRPGRVDTRPVWEGFAATRPQTDSLAAYALGPVDVYKRPGAKKARLTLDATTIIGTVTVLGVIGEPREGWVEVMLPIRPNGSTGWVRADDVTVYVADSRIVVDLTARTLAYLVDGVEVLSTEVGIGSRYNETPTGEYFVTDRVQLENPNSPWGPHALGLSARSDTVTEYNGGDGIIGIHGTNNPSSIGSNISLGCVRLPNELITELYEMVPLGTRVEIRA